jgi:hypothetical protein
LEGVVIAKVNKKLQVELPEELRALLHWMGAQGDVRVRLEVECGGTVLEVESRARLSKAGMRKTRKG